MPSSGYTAISFTAGEQPTTAKWNLVGSNDASFNNGNGFNDGIILSRHFATNSVPAAALDTAAICLGYKSITSTFSTSSTSPVQVTGLAATVTIPSGSRRVKITAWSEFIDNGTASFVEASIWDGAVGSGTQLALVSIDIQSTTRQIPMTLMAVVQPTAGTKTYSIGLRSTAGTGQLYAAATSPAFILVEAI